MTKAGPQSIRTHAKDDIRDRNIAVYLDMASMPPPIDLHAALGRDLLNGSVVIRGVCKARFSYQEDYCLC